MLGNRVGVRKLSILNQSGEGRASSGNPALDTPTAAKAAVHVDPV